MTPEVSVYCTVRNGEHTLSATLQSIAGQRAVCWELVVVDDGSSDRTPGLLREFAGGFPSGQVSIITTPGVGRGPALNLAWSSCRADLIANVDADDLFHPDKLRIQADIMVMRPDIVLLTTESLYISANQEPVWQPPDVVPAPRDITTILGRFNPVNHSSVMMRRAFLQQIGGYDPARVRQLDYELWVRAIEQGFRLLRVEAPLSAKRLHPGQSFEARISRVYVLSSFHLQNRAIRALNLPFRYSMLSLLRLVYRFLPTPIRRALARGKNTILNTPDR